METVREGAPKRSLDEDDDDDDHDDKKKLKIDPEDNRFSPVTENLQDLRDAEKWNLLPTIVYELLALFKKSENLDSDEDKQEKIDNDIKEDFKVVSNHNCQEKLLDNAFIHENLKEVDRCDTISIEHSNLQVSNTTKDSIQNLNKLDFSAKYTTEDVSNKVPLVTNNSPVKLFAENTDVHKAKQTEDKSNRKIIVVKKQLKSEHNVCHLSVSTKSVPCIYASSDDVSKADMSTESISNAATPANSIYNTPKLTSKTNISNTPILISTNSIFNSTMCSSTNNNTIIEPENSAHKVISKTENIFRAQMLGFLYKNCLNGISATPLTKPSPCVCKCCTIIASLPLNQSAVYSLLFTSVDNLSYTHLDYDMNSSNVPVVDCSISSTNDCYVNKSNTPHTYENTLINADSPKNIWVNDLTSLISKNEYTSKEIHAANTKKKKKKKKLNPMQNVINKVHKATKKIKSRILSCKKCKKCKFSESDGCKCYSRSHKHNYNK